MQSETKQSKFKRICVFCGSSQGKKTSYQEAAIELGKELVLLSWQQWHSFLYYLIFFIFYYFFYYYYYYSVSPFFCFCTLSCTRSPLLLMLVPHSSFIFWYCDFHFDLGVKNLEKTNEHLCFLSWMGLEKLFVGGRLF